MASKSGLRAVSSELDAVEGTFKNFRKDVQVERERLSQGALFEEVLNPFAKSIESYPERLAALRADALAAAREAILEPADRIQTGVTIPYMETTWRRYRSELDGATNDSASPAALAAAIPRSGSIGFGATPAVDDSDSIGEVALRLIADTDGDEGKLLTLREELPGYLRSRKAWSDDLVSRVEDAFADADPRAAKISEERDGLLGRIESAEINVALGRNFAENPAKFRPSQNSTEGVEDFWSE